MAAATIVGAQAKVALRPLAAIGIATTALSSGFASATPSAVAGPLERAACDAGPFETLRPAGAGPGEARAGWLDGRTVLWPRIDAAGRCRLYHARGGGIAARPGMPVTGADGSLERERIDAPPAAPVAAHFRHPAAGVRLAVSKRDAMRVPELLRGEVVLVREEQSVARDTTRLQLAGALDDLYARAAAVGDLGATVRAPGTWARTTFGLWAPTAA